MGIPEGLLNEATWRALLLIGSLILVTSIRKTIKDLDDRNIIKYAVTGGCILLFRSINLPVFGGYGTFIGAALPSLVFGAWPAALLMGLVLIVESVAFTDIGVTNLGLLYIAAGLVSPQVAVLSSEYLKRYLGNNRLLVYVVSTWLSVVAAAVITVLIITIAAHQNIADVIGLFTPYLTIGLIEGILTAVFQRYLFGRQP